MNEEHFCSYISLHFQEPFGQWNFIVNTFLKMNETLALATFTFTIWQDKKKDINDGTTKIVKLKDPRLVNYSVV